LPNCFVEEEARFLSLAHSQKSLDKTIEACDATFKKIWSLNDLNVFPCTIPIPIIIGFTYMSTKIEHSVI
jgi:hypothetical protein